MRIDAYNQVSRLYAAAGKTQAKKTAKSSAAEDRLEISQLGKDYQVAKAAVAQADDVREDRVAEVKAKYEAGKYDVSANKLAAKLMEKYNSQGYITF